jgi:uncharacterized protein (TIGR03032 family)
LKSSRLKADLFVPTRSVFLPGDFAVHDVTKIKSDLFVTATGLNFVAKVHADGGYERVWHPRCMDRLGRRAFTANYLQLNSIARGRHVRDSFFSAFSDQPTREKPWKAGYGPKGKGVVFEGSTRETVFRGLTCPHSIRRWKNQLWVCNSGMGELAIVDPKRSRYHVVARLQGFTRGLAFLGPYALVGLSKVIPAYEPYAPGLDSRKSKCGLALIHVSTGRLEAEIEFPRGFQVYDVQTLDGVQEALLPSNSGENMMNFYLTYYGWDRQWARAKRT